MNIRIYLLMNEDDYMDACLDILEDMRDICVIGAQKDSKQGYEEIMNLQPDIVIAEVLMPYMNGYMLMDYVRHSGIGRMPQFIFCFSILSEQLSSMMDENVLSLVVFPIQKLVLKKQLEGAFARFEQMKKERMNQTFFYDNDIGQRDYLLRETSNYNLVRADLRKNNLNIRQMIGQELNILGARKDYVGFVYMESALEIMLSGGEGGTIPMMHLYEKIGERYQVPARNVERGIRTIIAQIWKHGNVRYLECIFGKEMLRNSKKPSNGFFLQYMTLWLRNEA